MPYVTRRWATGDSQLDVFGIVVALVKILEFVLLETETAL